MMKNGERMGKRRMVDHWWSYMIMDTSQHRWELKTDAAAIDTSSRTTNRGARCSSARRSSLHSVGVLLRPLYKCTVQLEYWLQYQFIQ
jgi:hypothetical protein